MSKNYKFVIAVFILVLTALIGLTFKDEKTKLHSSNNDSIAEDSKKYKSQDVKQKALEDLDKKIINELDVKNPKVVLLDEKSIHTDLVKRYKRLQEAKKYFNSSALEKNELRELLKTAPITIQISENALINLDFAISSFQSDQAIARVYAIKVLKENAIMGDTHSLTNTIKTLSKILDHQEINKIEIKKGQDKDLADLIYAYIEVNKELSLFESPIDLANSIGYHEVASKKIKTLIEKELFYSLLPKLGRDKSKEIINQLKEA